MVRRLTGALAVAAIITLPFLTSPTARADVTGRCNVSIAGQGVAGRSFSDPSQAIKVERGSEAPVAAVSRRPIDAYRIQMEFVDLRWTVAEGSASGRSWSAVVDVDRYARYGVGLYRVIATSSGREDCIARALVRVEGNPLGTVAGAAAAGVTGVGVAGVAAAGIRGAIEGSGEGSRWMSGPPPTPEGPIDEAYRDQIALEDEIPGDPADERVGVGDELGRRVGFPGAVVDPRSVTRVCVGMILPVLVLTLVTMAAGGRVRWRPRISILGLIGGVLAGLGSVVLMQQYAIAYPTRNLAILAVVLGAVGSILVSSLGRLIAVRRFNRRLA